MKTVLDKLALADNAGYVMAFKSKHPQLPPGYITVYDRQKGFEIDADERWIVMHEPSSHHVAIRTRAQAESIARSVANGGNDVDLGQYETTDE